jgi:hypothetical protein
MGLKFNVKFLFVDESLKILKCIIDACTTLYTLCVGMDTSTHGKLEKPNYSKQFQE